MRPIGLLLALVVVSGPTTATPQGDPLGPEFRVNTYTMGYQGSGSVAADSAGNFVVVWTSITPGSGYDAFGQRYASSGAVLGPEFRVNTYTTGQQRLPLVASDTTGNFVVVWQSLGQDGSSYGVFGQRFAGSGIPLGPEFRVNTDTSGGEGWGQYLPGAAITSDSSGNFVVVWQTFGLPPPGFDLFGQRFASSGVPLGSQFRVNTFTTNHQGGSLDGGGLAISAAASGNFVVVWQSYTQDGSSLGVFGQRYAGSGEPLGPEFLVNSFTTAAQAQPTVGADRLGNFVVVWHSVQDGPYNYGIFGQRYASSGTPLGSEFRVNTVTTNTQSFPSVSADSSGNFVVVWRGYDGSGTGLLGQRYASSGMPVGPEFRVNTFTPGPQGLGRVASDISGNFVTVWLSLGQDGSSWGVFGQRYNMMVPVELMHLRVE